MNIIPKMNKILLYLALILGMPWALWYAIPICPLRPVFNVLVGHQQKLVVAASANLSPNNVKVLTKILVNNDEAYCIMGNKIMITPKLFFDKELLWNYTTKSGMSYPDDNYYHDRKYNLWRRK